MNRKLIYIKIYEQLYGIPTEYHDSRCDQCNKENLTCYGLGGPSYPPYNGQDVLAVCGDCFQIHNKQKFNKIEKIIDAAFDLGFIDIGFVNFGKIH